MGVGWVRRCQQMIRVALAAAPIAAFAVIAGGGASAASGDEYHVRAASDSQAGCPPGLGANETSGEKLERSGTLTGGHGIAPFHVAAGPGVVRGTLSGEVTFPARVTPCFMPEIRSRSDNTFTFEGPGDFFGFKHGSLNYHVGGGTVRRTCGEPNSCSTIVSFTVKAPGNCCNTIVVIQQDGAVTVGRNELGLTVTPLTDGFRIEPKDGTIPLTADSAPFLVRLEMSVEMKFSGNGAVATSTWDADFGGPGSSGQAITLAPSGPVFNFGSGTTGVSGASIVDNRWTDPFAPTPPPPPDTIHEGDLVVTDCEDPFLAVVTEITGSLIIEDLTCDATLSFPALVRVGGHVRIVGSNATEIDLAVLVDVGSSFTVVDNGNTTVVDLGALVDVGSSFTVVDNGNTTVVDLGALVGVGGDFIVEDNGSAQVSGLAAVQDIGGDFIVETTGNDSFTATTADGVTDITILGGTAQMNVVLPEGTFSQPVGFTIAREPDAAAEIGTGSDGRLASVDPVGGYHFSFDIPTLDRRAELAFTIDLSQLDAPTREALLAGVEDGNATIAVKGDEEGATYQSFRRCAVGETPAANECVAVVLVDADGNPAAAGTDAAFVRFEGVAGHFSTYAVVLVAPLDTTPPSVVCDTPSPVFQLGEQPAVVTATVTDDGSGPEAGTASGPADTSTVGAKTVVLTGRDLEGNEASATCPYDVRYGFVGFQAPIDNAPVLNVANAGRTVPIKYRLTTFDGTGVSDTASFDRLTSVKVACGSLDTQGSDALETYSGSSGVQYLGDGYWQVNWATPKSYASTTNGPCRVMTLKLADGSMHEANFRFK